MRIRSKCRHCEYSIVSAGKVVGCSEGRPISDGTTCDDYYCAPIDKLDGTRCKQGECFICGRPVYKKGEGDTPIYCKDHKDYALRDSETINHAPKETLFGLIAGIFLRAREDYLYNTDGKGRDAEMFLKGEWAQFLSGDGFNVEQLFETLDRMREDESE